MKRFLQGVLAIILAMTVAVFGLTSILGTGVASASTETYVFRACSGDADRAPLLGWSF